MCPPFQCTQDEESLTLLVQVPGIQPQSVNGEVGTNHYRLSFSTKDTASYSFFLQFPFENKLTAPETGVNVSPNNAVIGLAKSPESTGLWKKLSFGLNSHTLQVMTSSMYSASKLSLLVCKTYHWLGEIIYEMWNISRVSCLFKFKSSWRDGKSLVSGSFYHK